MSKPRNTKGKVVVVSGPSGVGKSTICREVVRRLDNAYLSVSVTTRPRGPGEANGREYWFVSDKEFDERVDNGLFLEHAQVFGHRYGTPKDKIDQAVSAGKTVILEIDVQGGRQVKALYPDAVMIFVLPPTEKTLAERLGRRGRDAPDVARKRLDGAGNEVAAAWQSYDNMVINEDLQQAVGEVAQIIQLARGESSGDNGTDIGDKDKCWKNSRAKE